MFMFNLENIQQFNNIIWPAILLTLWSIPWKGAALWKAAKNDHKAWFVILLLVNTIGILEILYIFIFSKPSKKDQDIIHTALNI